MSVKISGLKETTVLSPNDVLPIVNSAETKKVKYSTIREDILNKAADKFEAKGTSEGTGGMIAGISASADSMSEGGDLASGKLYIIYE